MFKFLNDLELYVALKAAGESKTLLEASRKLGVSQATVSLRLKRLQSQSGYPLFEYQGKRLVFTQRGRELFNVMSELLAKFPSDIQQFHLERNLPSPQPLRLGARIEVYDKLVPYLTVGFPLDMRLMNSLELNQQLIDLKIDVGISHFRPENSQFISIPLYRDEFTLCCHRRLLQAFGKALPARERHSIESFVSNVPGLSYGHESRLLNDWLSSYSIPKNRLKLSVICENWNTLTDFLKAGAGFGIFPKSFTRYLPKQVLVQAVPHEILAPLRFYMIYRKAYRTNQNVQELKTALRSKFRDPES